MPTAKKKRRRQPEETRRAIIEAAHAEFVDKGFHGATVSAIAARAGVAEQTVYFVFSNKPSLMSAVIDAAVLGPGEPIPPQEQFWWQETIEEPDAVRALQTFVRGAGPVFARAATISEVLRAAALTDPDVRQTHEFHENLRREAFGEVLDHLAAKRDLRAGLSRDQVLDVFLLVYGDATYHLLTTELGWTHDEVMDWLCQELPRLIFELR